MDGIDLKTIYTYTDKAKSKIEIPEWWGDKGTTRIYQRLVKEWDASDILQLFSILSGIEYKTLSDTHDPNLEQSLIEATRFIYDTEPAFKKAKAPSFIEIDGKRVNVPKKLGSLSLGQNIMIRQEMEKAKVFDELISITVAVYLQPLLDKSEYNHDRAMELNEKILNLPITETYPIGIFFLKPLLNYGPGMMARWLLMLTRLWRRFMKSVKDLVKWRRFRGLKGSSI